MFAPVSPKSPCKQTTVSTDQLSLTVTNDLR